MYEGAVREPLAVVWPGHIPAGTVSHEITTSPDFYPTLLELAGLPLQPQQHVDGVSFAGLLLGKEDSLDREAVYWHYPHYGNQGGTPGSSLRSGRWKYIEFYEDNSRHLFDLETDVAERRTWRPGTPIWWSASTACWPAGCGTATRRSRRPTRISNERTVKNFLHKNRTQTSFAERLRPPAGAFCRCLAGRSCFGARPGCRGRQRCGIIAAKRLLWTLHAMPQRRHITG